jgi:hypothetical protein
MLVTASERLVTRCSQIVFCRPLPANSDFQVPATYPVPYVCALHGGHRRGYLHGGVWKDLYRDWRCPQVWLGAEAIMIRNGLYSLAAVPLNGANYPDVGGVLILRDGEISGGDSFVFYTGTYECSEGNWQGKMTSQEHTPTTRPMPERIQHIGFRGTYNDEGATVDAMAIFGERSIRYDATLRLLAAT